MPEMESNRNFFPPLTGIRSVAAIMVFLHHYLANHPRLPVVLNMLVSKMYIGLTLFFVLTGFLFAFRYFPTARVSGRFLKRFYQNRFVRVYPIYLLLTLITLLGQGITDWKVWSLNLTMSKSLFNDYKLTGIPQAWSLTVIEMFYLLAPLLPLWIARKKSLWWWLLPSYAAGLLLVWLSKALGWGSFFEHIRFMLIFTVFGHAFAFLLGMWCWSRAEAIKAWFSGKGIGLTYTSIAGLLAVVFAWSYASWSWHFVRAHEYGGIFITNVLTAVFFAGLIIGLITEPETLVSKALSGRVMLMMGRSSYGFYLLNIGFFATFVHQTVSANPVVIFVVTAAAAYLLHRYFEQPLIKRFGGSRIMRPATLTAQEKAALPAQPEK